MLDDENSFVAKSAIFTMILMDQGIQPTLMLDHYIIVHTIPYTTNYTAQKTKVTAYDLRV